MRKILFFGGVIFIAVFLLKQFVLPQNQEWEVALFDVDLTKFDRVLVSTDTLSFSINRLDNSAWIQFDELSYPVTETKIDSFFLPFKNLKTNHRIPQNQFKIDGAHSIKFSFRFEQEAPLDFSLVEKEGDIFYKAKVSGDYFKLPSNNLFSLNQFDVNNLLLPALDLTIFEESLMYRVLNQTDTLILSPVDSTFKAYWGKYASLKVVHEILNYEWNYRLELVDSSQQILSSFNLFIDRLSNRFAIEQTHPYQSVTPISSADSILVKRMFLGI